MIIPLIDIEYKRFKSNTSSELLHRETNIHFINYLIIKIDLNIFSNYLYEKDECTNLELEHSMFDNSSYSNNHVLSYL